MLTRREGVTERLYGVKSDTAYRICGTRNYTTKVRGGSRGKEMHEESLNLLLIMIETRPDITLEEMRKKIIIERGVTVSTSTKQDISRGV